MESEDTSNDFRAASFAVYLNPTDSFVKRLGDSSRHTAVPREDRYLPFGPVKIANREGEIGVFSAEKYFNMNLEDGPSPRLIDDYARRGGYKKESHLEPCASISKSRSVTTSVSYESSWNGHATLLRGFQKSSTSSSFSCHGRSLFRRLGCNKSCSDEKSILSAKEDAPAPKHQPQPPAPAPKHQPQPPVLPINRVQIKDGLQCSSFDGASSTGSKRDDLFAFPILGGLSHKEPEGRRLREDVGSKDGVEHPRNSIEVFGSSRKDKKKVDEVALNLDRKLSILTWDAIPKLHCPKASSKSVLNDDLESEASSDLFEIENISGAASATLPFTPHPPDGFSFYEPSEVSIEWSVVTASAADFSAVSEYDEKEVLEINSAFAFRLNPRSVGEREGVRSRPVSGSSGGGGGLLGCKSHKSVRVAEMAAVKTNEKPRILPQQPHQKLDSTIICGGKSLVDNVVK